jgi:hypothetical protein
MEVQCEKKILKGLWHVGCLVKVLSTIDHKDMAIMIIVMDLAFFDSVAKAKTSPITNRGQCLY